MALEDIAGYSLRRGLGSGATGSVWLLRDLGTGRHAVLKRIPAAAVPAVEEFRRDLALTRSIDNPHVARLLDVRQTDRDWLLFSQYVAAGTLASLLERRKPLSTGELVTLIGPLAQGLAVIHQSGLAHGNLTLDNVMLDAEGRPVLTDLGLRSLTGPSATPESDLEALAELAVVAGGDPGLFEASLFTGDAHHTAQRVLRLAAPTPIAFLGTTASHPTSPPAAGDFAGTNIRPPTPRPASPTSAAGVDGTSPDDSQVVSYTSLADDTGSNPTGDDPASDGPPPGAPSGASGASSAAGDSDESADASGSGGGKVGGAGVLNGNRQAARRKRPKDGTSERTREPLGGLDPEVGAEVGGVPDPAAAGSSKSPAASARAGAGGARQGGKNTADRPAKRRGGGPQGRGRSRFSEALGEAGGRRRLEALGGGRTGDSPRPAHGPSAGRGGGRPGVRYRSGNRRWSSHRGRAGRRRSRQPWARVRLRLSERLRGRAPAYGVLAAMGAAAVVVLVLGLITVGVLGGGPSTAASTGDAGSRGTDPSVAAGQPAKSNGSTPNHSGSHQPAITTPPGADWPTPWLNVLKTLDQKRSTVFNTGDVTGLDAIYVRGSVPWNADKNLLASYRTQHLRIEGLTMEIRSLVIEREETDTAVLQIVDRLASGAAVDPAGRRAPFPIGKPTARRILLRAQAPGDWRIAEITTL